VAYMPISAVNAILVTAGLGFLGIGVRPPTPEWGGLIASGTEDLISGGWWTSVFPGIALVIVSLAFYLIGDGLERRRL
jgi:peptide/nickel transport system permease protein